MANSNGATDLGNTPPPDPEASSEQAQIPATTTQLTAANLNAAPMSAANTNSVPALDDKAEATLRAEKKQKRTVGLKLFDVFLYPVLNNISVFAISVGATYLTTRGGMKDASGNLRYGKVGEFFQKRGDWMVNKLTGAGMSKGAADMSKMVFFSFADGSIMAPLIKKLEDHREHIAQGIDVMLGTKPEDISVYASEPKQSWLSVLGGRLATVAVVVPTAVVLEKTHIKAKDITLPKTHKDRDKKVSMNLNQYLFNNPGLWSGAKLQEKGWFKGLAAKHDMTEISRVSIFEAFYTSVCTGGLYFISRAFARKQGEHHEHKTHPSEAPRADAPSPAPIEPPVATRRDIPDAQVSPERTHQGQGVASPERDMSEPALAAAR